MKTLQFTIPVAHDRTVIIQEDRMPHFYPHLHRHHEAQLMWILEGKGTLIVENNMHSFQENDIFLIGSNQSHVFKSNAEYFDEANVKQVRSISVFFDPKGKLASLFDLPELYLLQRFVKDYESGFKVPNEHFREVSRRILRLKEASQLDQLMHFFFLLRTLSLISEQATALSGGKSSSISENEGIRIGSIYHYIAQNFMKPITLDEVANQANLTPQAFCRYFKKHTRNTFVAFLNEMRVHEACKKLTQKKCESISSVAYTCGFNSITNFNRVFKSVMGNSPKEYMVNFKRNIA
ncbi:AraC family transcriptional regulator [Olivibacter ginsenosidimutans]|uniref:AraC family transcriptional regulator n=1 Tax=Olivibacter ginsenosidimutans TaxID=1176537 RepID=A0ABP9C473_9SPHI